MSMLFRVCVFFAMVTHSLSHASSVRLPSDGDRAVDLHVRLVLEALKRGGEYKVSYPFQGISDVPLGRILNAVDSNEVDVFFSMTSKELEDKYQAIYIPLYRGMMGMRLGIVKSSNKTLFNGVTTLSDLKAFSAGQGKLWADAAILEANGIPVVKELKYANLFRMLEAERFDYFPRGVHEPWAEVKRESNLNLAVDSAIMLFYKAPFYVFVKKTNHVLAKHLTNQFESMIADGSFLQLFYADKNVKMGLENANLHARSVIRLDNPFLTKHTPVDRLELWFNPEVDIPQEVKI